MCTSVLAGINATAQNIIIVSRNEDAGNNNKNKYLIFRPVPEYHQQQQSDTAKKAKPALWTLGNDLQVPIPKNEFTYSGMPDADGYFEAEYSIGNRFFYEERGINEKNVAISATNSLTSNKKAIAADPFVKTGGIAEAIIPTLLLPQAESAEHAIQLLGGYVEKYGAFAPNGILIGDIRGAWYFEIGSGHHWICTRIPDDHYFVVANGMRTHNVDLDCETVQYSEGLFEFVVEHQLLEKPGRNDFNFAQAFGIPGVPYNTDRVWLGQKILTPSLVQKPHEFQYPMFLKPDDKIEVAKVMEVLRATYKGTILEGKARRPIGVDRTAESHIMTLDPSMPYELQCLIWQCVGAPLGCPYMPMYAIMDDIPLGYAKGGDEYGTGAAYWAFRGLFALSSVNDDKYIPELKKLWSGYEQKWLNEHLGLSEMLMEMYKENKQTAIDFAKQYSTGIASLAVDMAQKHRNEVITAITAAQGPNTLPIGEGEV